MRHRAALGLLALLALLAAAGCGTRRSVLETLPPDAISRPPAARSFLSSRPLRHGERMVVRLVDGDRVRGEVAALKADSLVLRLAYADLGRSPALLERERPLRSIAYADIVQAEVVGRTSPPTLGDYLLATLVVILGTGLLARTAS